MFEGDVRESAVFRWMNDAYWVGVPRYSTLRVKTDDGELIRDYDTRDIPPVPEGFRPISASLSCASVRECHTTAAASIGLVTPVAELRP